MKQLKLNHFGFIIYNANVKQLVDVLGHKYFSYMSHATSMITAGGIQGPHVGFEASLIPAADLFILLIRQQTGSAPKRK